MQHKPYSRIRQDACIFSSFVFFIFCVVFFSVSFFQPPPLQAPQQTAAPSHANHCNSCYRLPCFPLVRSRLLVTSWTVRMGRFKKGGSKPACKLKLSSGELKFITDHTSFTEDHIKEWHKVNRSYINEAGWPKRIFKIEPNPIWCADDFIMADLTCTLF